MAHTITQDSFQHRERMSDPRAQIITYGIIAMVLASMLMAPGVEFFLSPDGRFQAGGTVFHWDQWVVTLHLVSDLLIGMSYVAISGTLWYLAHKARRDIPFLWTFIAFGIFIIACGFTHFVGALTLWVPLFWAAASIKVLTAIASVATAVAVPPLVPRVLALVESLKASERQRQQLRAQAELLDLAHDAILVRALEGATIQYWNPGAVALYGYDSAEAVGRVSHELLKSTFPEPLRDIEAQVRETGAWEGEIAHITRDGRKVIVASRWATQRASVEAMGILEINRDITEAKTAERALVQLNHELETRVAERTQELEQALVERNTLLEREHEARASAEDALHLRDEFLSVASHELKTPLTALQLQLQMLRRALRRAANSGLAEDRVRNVLDSGERQVKRLTRLNDDLLDVSRIATGRFELELERCDLRGVVQRAVQVFVEADLSGGSEIRLEAGCTAEGLWDQFRMEQVLINLLTNAVKFGLGKPIDVQLQAEGKQVTLSVTDRGIGIEPEDQARIFDRFERAVSAHNFGGLGLGLYIARRIIVAHNGSIEVSSRPGEGSTFTVHLPVTAEDNSINCARTTSDPAAAE